MATRISASMLVAVVLLNMIGFGAISTPAFAASLQCGSMTDLGIPGLVNRRFSLTSPPCFRMRIQPGVTRLRVYVWTSQGILDLYMGQTQSSLPALVIDTGVAGGAQVTPNQIAFKPSSLTPGYLVLALSSVSGSVDGDVVRVKSEIYVPPPPAPKPSGSSSIGKSTHPLGTEVEVGLSPISVVKKLGKAQPPISAVLPPPAAVIEAVVPAAPAEQPPPQPPAPDNQQPTPPPAEQPPPAPQPQPAANTGNIDPFPCSRAGIGVSNLCIEQPYPVRRGTTAFVVWNIQDFSYGEFDRGDGQGFRGPIYPQQRVDVPGIDAPRTVRLRWLDKSGAERLDTFTIQVVD